MSAENPIIHQQNGRKIKDGQRAADRVLNAPVKGPLKSTTSAPSASGLAFRRRFFLVFSPPVTSDWVVSDTASSHSLGRSG